MKSMSLVRGLLLVLAGACVLYSDCDCCGPYVDLTEIHVLDASDWYYELVTPAANKDCHAQFRLEIAWNNSERRRDPTQESPFIDTSDMRYEFRSSEGSFTLFQIGPVKDSIEDNGDWVYYWYWTDDVGAKNEASNPTFYKIITSAPALEIIEPRPEQPTWWQIWVRASIDYVAWEP